ncbi:GIY-YIG nuclease family protein [Aidingimonas lacisalsi]|uniref:GIY-YIG nuclease family protein n=1 Tax=Aidingimonas lacisalsi TaxID=2604086 RepID=UPI0011D27406|nr:GIY-YIG nuclease family protein [Aidingimonas lacisalsi]
MTDDTGQVWHLYVVRTAGGALYTGITTDVERRLREHRQSRRGARALRGKGPLTLCYHVALGSRSEALKLEARLKKLPANKKRAWLEARRNEAPDRGISATSSWV